MNDASAADSHLFPKVSKAQKKRIINLLQPIPYYQNREVFCKIPIYLPVAGNGKTCSWLVPRDNASHTTEMIGAETYYPFHPSDLVAIYDSMFAYSAGLATQTQNFDPIGTLFNQTAAINTSRTNMLPTASFTVFPGNTRRLLVGFTCRYVITNSCNVPLDYKAFKVVPRHHIDAATFSPNIITEYANGLWENGIGTLVSGTLSDVNYGQFLYSNEFDLYDSNGITQNFKIKRTKSFRLSPGRKAILTVKVKPRLYDMRTWFNDAIAATGPVTTDCPWVRFKGIPEWVVKFTTPDGSVDLAEDLYDASSNPEYGGITTQVPGVSTLHYQINYQVKKYPFPSVAYRQSSAAIGQGAGTTASGSMINSTIVPGVVKYA